MTVQTQLSDVDAGSLPIESSLFALMKQSLDRNPHSPIAIVTHQSRDHLKALRTKADGEVVRNEECLTWTYTDVYKASLKLISGFAKYGIEPGASIATFVPNGIEAILFHWVSMVGKYTYAPLDPGATNPVRSAEAQTLLGTIMPDIIVATNGTAAANLDSIIGSLSNKPTLKIVLDSSANPSSGWIDLLNFGTETIDAETERRITTEALADDLERISLIMFTSGTSTGKPKGCPISVRSRLHFTHGMDLRTEIGTACRYGYITQNYRAIAVCTSTIAYWKGGCLVMPGPGFSPPDLLNAIQKYGINWIVFVPFALLVLVAHPNFAKTDVSSLKTIGMGADVVTRDLYLKASKAFPHTDIWIAHGMTEGGAAFVWPLVGKTKEADIPWYTGDIAPIGKVAVGTRLRISSEDNKAVPRNVVGEIHLSSHAFIRRYSQDVKPEDFYVEGTTYWFKTGDTGLMNSDGWIYILGRKKDIIKRAGVPVVPGALESALDAFLKSQSSVVAVPHETLGHEPYAVVRSLNGYNKEQVKKHIVDMFGSDYALGGVATLEDLGLADFPINQSEKIMKLDLQRAIAHRS